LAEEFGVADRDETDLYAAMDWLLERQKPIEKKLAAVNGKVIFPTLGKVNFPRCSG
jgi:hypothetical protein